jgi:hypothetical protein
MNRARGAPANEHADDVDPCAVALGKQRRDGQGAVRRRSAIGRDENPAEATVCLADVRVCRRWQRQEPGMNGFDYGKCLGSGHGSLLQR